VLVEIKSDFDFERLSGEAVVDGATNDLLFLGCEF
jgi:hypothetical protein